jgi:glutamyl-tRNA reductase
VASVAVDYARQIYEQLADKTVLCIGAGKMAALVLRHFAALSPRRLLVCNRSADRAQALAAQFHGQAVPFESMHDHLVAADVVVSSTGAGQAIITRRQFELLLRQRRYRPIFLIDIALPRDIEPAVGELDHVYLYNIDDLQQVVAATQAQRSEAVDAARRIIDREVDEFVASQRTRELGPLIERLYERYHAIARDELARVIHKLPGISDAQRGQLEDLARRIVNKVLHDPVQRLRSTPTSHGGQVPYLHAMEHLFNLLEDAAAGSSADPVTDEDERDQA